MNLPELPEPFDHIINNEVFTAQQMRAYAEEAVKMQELADSAGRLTERCDVGHAHFTPFYLLANCRRLTSRKFEREPNWVLAANLFAVGSTTATRLCREAGIDPYALEVRKVDASISRKGSGKP